MSIQKPPVTVIGTHGQNVWKDKGLPKKAVVLHVMEGTLAGCDSWFSSPQAQASSNYGVGKDGSIHQYVDPEGPDAPFANGIVSNPDSAFQALAAANPLNPNYWTVSIEHEGMSGQPLTPAQLDASAHLTAWLCQRFAIPADEAHLLGHYEIDSVTRAGCPGWDRAGWVAYELAVAKWLSQPVPTPQPDWQALYKADHSKLTAIMHDLPALEAEIVKFDVEIGNLDAIAAALKGDAGL